jgi:phosphatidylserine synthase
VILSYYIVTQDTFLTPSDNSDLYYLVLFIMASLSMVIISAIELIQYKQMDVKNRIINSFCFISSLMFIIAVAYSFLYNN